MGHCAKLVKNRNQPRKTQEPDSTIILKSVTDRFVDRGFVALVAVEWKRLLVVLVVLVVLVDCTEPVEQR